MNKASAPPAVGFQAQRGPESRFHNRMSSGEGTGPTFYQIKKTPPSTSWNFQVHRRPENRSHYSYRASGSSDSAYGWVLLIVFLSFSFGFLVADVIYHLHPH